MWIEILSKDFANHRASGRVAPALALMYFFKGVGPIHPIDVLEECSIDGSPIQSPVDEGVSFHLSRQAFHRVIFFRDDVIFQAPTDLIIPR
jgi:hypothetical protein